ncbi:MAG: hypothetical protein ABFC63_05075 [Thermoguttaceae bacterium]
MIFDQTASRVKHPSEGPKRWRREHAIRVPLENNWGVKDQFVPNAPAFDDRRRTAPFSETVRRSMGRLVTTSG